MPIYEYECPTHGIFEQFSQKIEDIPFVMCEHCDAQCEKVYSLCAMQPDNMWSGVTNEHGYFTSKKQHLSYLKDKSLVRVERGLTDSVKKKSKRRVPERLAKNEQNLDKFLQKELASI